MIQSKTERWFDNFEFTDDYNNDWTQKKWTLQKCSHALTDCFWLYVWEEKIHITNDDIQDICAILKPYCKNTP